MKLLHQTIAVETLYLICATYAVSKQLHHRMHNYLSLIYNGDLTFLKVKIFSGGGGILRDQKEYLAVPAMYSMIFFYGVSGNCQVMLTLSVQNIATRRCISCTPRLTSLVIYF